MPCNERHSAGRRRRNRSETDARGAVDSGPDRRGTEACESGPGADPHGSFHARRGATGPRRRLRETGRRPAPVGALDLFEFDPQHRRAGIGILIHDPAHRGKGFAADALDVVCRYARTVLGLHQLWCNVGADNTASLALFRRAGFAETGRKREWQWTPDGFRDEIMMQKILRTKADRTLRTDTLRPAPPGPPRRPNRAVHDPVRFALTTAPGFPEPSRGGAKREPAPFLCGRRTTVSDGKAPKVEPPQAATMRPASATKRSEPHGARRITRFISILRRRCRRERFFANRHQKP